jgi:hypothetical protein
MSTIMKIIRDEYLGKYVIVRTYASGVHFGKLKVYEPDIRHIVLEDTRIIYTWNGQRLSLREISLDSIVDGKMTVSIPQNIITDVLEILLVSERAEESLRNFKAYECK